MCTGSFSDDGYSCYTPPTVTPQQWQQYRKNKGMTPTQFGRAFGPTPTNDVLRQEGHNIPPTLFEKMTALVNKLRMRLAAD